MASSAPENRQTDYKAGIEVRSISTDCRCPTSVKK